MPDFNDAQLLRYSRHIVLPEVSFNGQTKLLQSSALIIGMGGLGTTSSLYLGASGVGHLVLVDIDTVDLSNLQRQISYSTSDIGRKKVLPARERILAINPDITVETHHNISGEKLLTLVQSADIVLDGTDNFKSRFTINQICITAQKPLVSAAVIGWGGQLAVFKGYKKDSPCYRCLYDEEGDDQNNCTNNGVLSPVAGLLATMQATQSIKVLLNLGQQLDKQLLLIDALEMSIKTLQLQKDKHCPVCKNSTPK